MASYLVGLTGGLASGKSTVAGWLREAGLTVVDADRVVAELYRPEGRGAAAVAEHFGEGYLAADGAVDRERLAGLVFADPEARRRLEAIVHPLVRERFAEIAAATDGIAVYEATLLVESGHAERFDLVVSVEAEESRRLRWAVARGMDEAAARARLAAQGDGARRRAGADRLLANDGTLDDLRREVDRLAAELRSRAEAPGSATIPPPEQPREDSPVSSLLTRYLATLDGRPPQSGAAAFYASVDHVAATAPTIASAIVRELRDQRANVKLIASENYCSLATQLAAGNLLTDKYAEGTAGHRFYAGCDNVDDIEAEASRLACELFGAEHAYVQPHSGADANIVAFVSILSATVQQPLFEKTGAKTYNDVSAEDWQRIREAFNNQRLLSMDYYSGGHLSHGYRYNVSSLLFDVHTYSVERDTRLLDYDRLREQVREVKPRIFLAGYSAYPRRLDFATLREMADEVGAVLMVDMAHFAGLVAGGVFAGDFDPVPHAHVVTSTTHKTLRGPRGGLILCQKEYAEWVDKGCPEVLGGPIPQAMAAKAVAFREALQPDFRGYARRIVDNARALAEALVDEGLDVVTGGTDNHLVLVDVGSRLGLTGRQAEAALRKCGLTLNRNSLPYDPHGAWYTSGLRLGTPAMTTLGMGPDEMREIAAVMQRVLSGTTPKPIQRGPNKGKTSQGKFLIDAAVVDEARSRVSDLLSQFPLYPELDLELLLSAPWMAADDATDADSTDDDAE